jgi:hypothetical protein
MRITALCFSAIFGVVVIGTAQSQCVYLCKERVNANFYSPPPVIGQPPSLSCVHYPDGRGGLLYTDAGNANPAVYDRDVRYQIVEDCNEACSAAVSPFHGQEAVANPEDIEYPINMVASAVCPEVEVP